MGEKSVKRIEIAAFARTLTGALHYYEYYLH